MPTVRVWVDTVRFTFDPDVKAVLLSLGDGEDPFTLAIWTRPLMRDTCVASKTLTC